jgi:hypothetical protein
MGAAADARRAVRERPRLRFRELDQVRHRLRLKRRVHDEYAGHVRHHRDRREIPDRVVRQLAKKRQPRREHATVREKQRVTVGRRASDRCRGYPPARAAAVIDDDGLVPQLGESLFENAPEDVGAAAGR